MSLGCFMKQGNFACVVYTPAEDCLKGTFEKSRLPLHSDGLEAKAGSKANVEIFARTEIKANNPSERQIVVPPFRCT